MGNIQNGNALVAQAQDSGGDQTGLLRLQGGGGLVEHHQPRRAVDQRAGNLHQLALGQAQVAHQPFGVDRQLPVLLEKLRRGGLHPSAIQRPPAGAILLAQKHRFRDGKVRDQVQLLVDNADAGGFDGCRIAEGQRVTVEGGAAAVGLIDTGEDLDQRRFTGAVLANQAMNLPRIEAQGNRIKRGDAGKTFTDLLHDQTSGGAFPARMLINHCSSPYPNCLYTAFASCGPFTGTTGIKVCTGSFWPAK